MDRAKIIQAKLFWAKGTANRHQSDYVFIVTTAYTDFQTKLCAIPLYIIPYYYCLLYHNVIWCHYIVNLISSCSKLLLYTRLFVQQQSCWIDQLFLTFFTLFMFIKHYCKYIISRNPLINWRVCDKSSGDRGLIIHDNLFYKITLHGEHR